MQNLSITYSALGRHQEAFELQEKTLAFYKSIDDYSNICQLIVCVFFQASD
jgi:hypothetical protein